ncbi:hypothetical protein PMAYCL1PPCAC_16514, partial [Pristionchus mayeri]
LGALGLLGGVTLTRLRELRPRCVRFLMGGRIVLSGLLVCFAHRPAVGSSLAARSERDQIPPHIVRCDLELGDISVQLIPCVLDAQVDVGHRDERHGHHQPGERGCDKRHTLHL